MSEHKPQTAAGDPDQGADDATESDGQQINEPTRNKLFVIPVGTGGLRTAQRIHSLEERLEPDLDIEYIPIESATIDSAAVPNEFKGIRLNTNDRIKKEFDQAKNDPSVPYLSPNHSLNIQGATRNPCVGRFLLERHDGRVKRSIGNEMRSALDKQDTSASIWLVGTGSGGTGSGILPLLAPLVRRAAEGIESKFDLDVRVNAMVTVSELRTDGQALDPEGEAEYYVNSSNTLQALATLQRLDEGANGDGLSTETIQTPVASTMDYVDITTPPLDKLFVAPIEEQRVDTSQHDSDRRESYLSRVNFKLASAILSLATVSAGDIGNTYNQLDYDMYTVDVANIGATVQAALDLLTSGEEIRAQRREREQLESHRDALGQLEANINALRKIEFEPGSVPETIDDISAEISGRSSQFIDATSVLDVTLAGVDEIQEGMSRVVTDLPERLVSADDFSDSPAENGIEDFDPEQFIPHRALGKYAFLNLVLAQIDAELEDHAFERRIDDLWEKNEEDLDANVRGLSEEDYTNRYEQGIDPYLGNSEAEIEEQIANTSWYERNERRRLRATLDSIQETREELSELFDEYEHLLSLRERLVDTELPKLETELEDVCELLGTRQTVAEDLIGEKESDIRAAETRRETCRQRVTPVDNFSGSVGDIPLNIDSMEDLSRKSLTEAESLFDLIDDGLLVRDSILRQISTALDIVSEPIEDNFDNSRTFRANSKLDKTLIPMTSAGNSGVLSMSGEVESDLQAINSRHDIGTVLSDCWVDSPFELTLVVLYGNVSLENASEFRVIQERWRQGSLDRLIGSDIDLSRHAAFPELVPAVQSVSQIGESSSERPIDGVADE